MDLGGSILNFTISVLILVLTFSTLYFTIKIYMNLVKYKKAALGLIFNKRDDSIVAFQIYAVAILIFAMGRILDLFNLISSSYVVDNLATVLYLVTDMLLVFAFYKLLTIIRLDDIDN
jgi:hypothetical protein